MGFRETFTKEDPDGLLGYDDTAFYYFASSILITLAIPWTWFVVQSCLRPAQESQDDTGLIKRGRKQTGATKTCKTEAMTSKAAGQKPKRYGGNFNCWAIQAVILTVIWLGLLFVVTSLSTRKEIKRFDPFEILEVDSSASPADIKKAYRKLSLIYHPDKNADDPLAATRFIEITKAYGALTDETLKANYEKWGNPDGPQTTKVGIGLPRFLLEKENQLVILSMFFFFLLFVVPMTFILYYHRTKRYAANGVMVETLQTLSYYVSEATRVKHCSELMACSAEGRTLEMRPTDNNAMKPLGQEVVEHKKRQFDQWPVIMKNNYLILGHMQRLHVHMSPELRQDLDMLLGYSLKVTQAMVEIACMREWFFTAQAMLEFRRNLVQALDIKTSPFFQVPHFTEEQIKQCKSGKNGASGFVDFLAKDPEQRKGMASLDPQQVLDIEAFTDHVTQLEATAVVSVEDEDEIVVGDIATVTVQLRRKNLNDGETVGPVHAPFFPGVKHEEWWVFLVEGTSRIIAYERVRSTEAFIEEKMRFQLSRPGKHKFDIHVISDSYAGLDQKVELAFNVRQENEVERKVVVHKEDEDLDKQPTLFQQLMGDFGPEEESEEEEDGDGEKAGSTSPAPRPPAGGGSGGAASEERCTPVDDDEESSDSSSDSE